MVESTDHRAPARLDEALRDAVARVETHPRMAEAEAIARYLGWYGHTRDVPHQPIDLAQKRAIQLPIARSSSYARTGACPKPSLLISRSFCHIGQDVVVHYRWHRRGAASRTFVLDRQCPRSHRRRGTSGLSTRFHKYGFWRKTTGLILPPQRGPALSRYRLNAPRWLWIASSFLTVARSIVMIKGGPWT